MKADRQSKIWHILGAGALGCLWAWHGRGAGADIVLVLRNRQRLQQFRLHGGISTLINGQRYTNTCAGLLAADIKTPVEQLLICCKAHQTVAAFHSLAGVLAPHCKVILLQNGMGVAEELLSIQPNLQLYAAVSTDGAHTVAPFTVQRAGIGTTRLGLYPADPSGSASHQVCEQLRFPGLALEACTDIYRAQWQKLAVSAVVNPLTALYGISNGALPSHPDAAPHIAPLCAEIAMISAAVGVNWSAGEIQQSVESVCAQTAANYSSMLQDIRQHRPTEIHYINGYLQRCAGQHDLPDPHNSALFERIKNLESAFSSAG